MLVLTRKPEESIQIGDEVVVKVIRTSSGAVKIGIEAPDHVRIVRSEVLERLSLAGQSQGSEAPRGSSTSDLLCAVADQYPNVA